MPRRGWAVTKLLINIMAAQPAITDKEKRFIVDLLIKWILVICEFGAALIFGTGSFVGFSFLQTKRFGKSWKNF
jgi:hypothetical protein